MSKTPARPRAQNDFDSNEVQAPLTALESRLCQAQSQLSPRRQQMIRKILANSEETWFLSSIELAKLYHVDPATIIRTIQALGYESFADFTADLRQHLVTRITPYTVLKTATQKRRSVADHIDHSLDKALENLNNLTSQLERNRVVELAKLIHRSQSILVVSVDLAASLASYLVYGLVALGFNAEAPIRSEGNLQHKVKVLTPQDLLIAISFGNVSGRRSRPCCGRKSSRSQPSASPTTTRRPSPATAMLIWSPSSSVPHFSIPMWLRWP